MRTAFRDICNNDNDLHDFVKLDTGSRGILRDAEESRGSRLGTPRIPRVRFGTGVGIRAVLPKDADIPREVVRTPNRPDGHGVYFAPHGDGRFYVGATCDIEIGRAHV